MHALEGRLTEGALANLVQYLAMNQASGCLQLLRSDPYGGAPARGAVFLVSGRVEHIEAAGLEGVPAMSDLLAWDGGRFAFAAGVTPPRRSLDLSVDALLLHASVSRDVARSGRPSANGAYAPSPASVNGSLPLGAAAVDEPRPAPRSGALLAGALAPQPRHAEPLAPLVEVVPLEATPLVDPALIPGLVWAAVAVVGPIGEIFVQEAFETIGHTPRLLPESALGALIRAVAGRFRSDEGRAQFVARAEAVLAHHGYGRVEESA